MVVYTNHFLKDWQAGCSIGPVILIRPCHKEDKGLLAHEQEHVRQWRKLPVLHSIRYALDKGYRQQCEVEAYAKQMAHGMSADEAARLLVERYGLGIEKGEALALLQEAG